MTGDPKLPDRADEDVAASASDIDNLDHTSTPDEGPLRLEKADLAKNEDGMPDDVTEGEGDVAPRRGGLFARLFKRDLRVEMARAESSAEPDPMHMLEAGDAEVSDGTVDTPVETVTDPDQEAPTRNAGLAAYLRKHTGRLSRSPKEVPEEPSEEQVSAASSLEDEHTAGSEVMMAAAPSVRAKKIKRPAKRGFPPIQVLIGWVGESSRKDVLEHARGFARDHMETIDTAWIAMAEFRGGTLFEIHEGGSGQSYLPDLIEELSRDPEQVLWVPSGTKLNRVVTFSIVEGRPFSMMLNEADSAKVRMSGQSPVERSGRMRRLSARGTTVLVIGSTLSTIALGALIASAYLSSSIDQQQIPALSYNAEILPHGQIVSLSTALREDRWVSRIVFENGAWRAEFETFDELVLPEDTDEAQSLIDEAVDRDAVLQEERERKIKELRSE